jgi:hypothetical protein
MADVKKFKVQYTNASGERVTEEPRLMVSADGAHKSLFLGEGTVLASAPYATSDADLWARARAAKVIQ